MRQMPVGIQLDLLTGLGNGYDLTEAGPNPLVIGGGVGVPPMYWLTKQLVAAGCKVTAVLGFNTAADVFYEQELCALGVRTIVEAKLNMASTRNLCIMGSVLCAGIGLGAIGGISLQVGSVPVNISALFVATVVGVIMNAILPHDFDEKIKRN